MSAIKSIFSPEQDYAFEKFCNGENVFISGAGGSGKSFLIRHFVRHLMLNKPNKKFQVTSTTGCSSVLLSENIQNTREYGKMISVKTIHSWSGIRLCKGDENKVVHSVINNRFAVKEWKKINVLFIDEVSMLSCKMLNVLEKIARITRKNCLPFGGIQTVFLGDMYQLAPVPDMCDEDTAKFCFESPVWSYIFPIENHIELKTVFRQSDATFKEILGEIRVGKLSDRNATILRSYIGKTLKGESDDDNPSGSVIVPPKILSTRSKVEHVNNTQYENIKEAEHVFECKIVTNFATYADSGKPIPIEYTTAFSRLSPQEVEFEIKSIKNNISAPNELKLKVGCPVMCLVNMNLEMGISNGSLGVVVDFVKGGAEHPIVKFRNGIRLIIEPHTWQNTDYPSICVQQYPLCLSFANTIHKLQGATLDMAVMDLGGSIFTEGQIYVALSRVRSLDGLCLIAFEPRKIRAHPRVVEFYSQFPLIEFVYEDEIDDSIEFSSDEDSSDDKKEDIERESSTEIKVVKMK
jgi:ATP-dependent DNA helicase PIF1